MSQAFMPNEWYRKEFSKVPRMMKTPPLMRLQTNSYNEFLQWDVSPSKRKDIGLQAVFKSIFPIFDFNKTVSLEFVSYTLEPPKYTVKECRQRRLSYESPLKVIVRLVFYDVTVDKDGNEQRSVSSVKEQEVYLGNIPLMAETGSFVYNGTERVIVSQLHRSPGIIFEHDSGKKHSSGNFLYSARVIPHRGSWLDFEFDHKNILFARIDRKRKFHGTVSAQSVGVQYNKIAQDVLSYGDHLFGSRRQFRSHIGCQSSHWKRGQTMDIVDKKGDVLVRKGKKFTNVSVKRIAAAGIDSLPISLEEIVGKVVPEDIFHKDTGEVIVSANEALSEAKIRELMEMGLEKS